MVQLSRDHVGSSRVSHSTSERGRCGSSCTEQTCFQTSCNNFAEGVELLSQGSWVGSDACCVSVRGVEDCSHN